VHEEIARRFPGADLSISIVWIQILANDSTQAAQQAAALLQHARIRHFHDPEQLAGRAMAERLGARGQVAWDTYLFYAAGAEWDDFPPVPFDWVHQLDEPWAALDHFAWADGLKLRLYEIIGRLLSH